MRSVLFALVATAIATVAAAQNTLRSIEYPIDGGVSQARSANVQDNALRVPEGSGFLWIVSIGKRNQNHALGGHFCGGAIVRPQWVLTAGHCLMQSGKPVDPDRIQVKVGFELDKKGPIHRVEKVIVHEKFSITIQNSVLYDVALIKLASPVANVTPAPMLNQIGLSYLKNNELTVLGWGKPGYASNYLSNRLRYLKLVRIPATDCSPTYYPPGLLDDTVVCALGDGTDACQGDSGGPLLAFDESGQEYSLYGIVSWGDQCGEAGRPGIYAQVPSHFPWIQLTIGKN